MDVIAGSVPAVVIETKSYRPELRVRTVKIQNSDWGSFGLKVTTEGKHETCHSFLAEETRTNINWLNNAAAPPLRKGDG